MIRLSLLFLLLCVHTVRCEGSAFADGTISMKVGHKRDITIDVSSVAFPAPTNTDLDNGYIEVSNAVSVTVNANTNWGLDISTSDNDLGTLGGHAKPLSDLQWKRSIDSNWTSYSQQAVRIQSNNKKADDVVIPLDFRLNLNWITDAPGTISTTVTFTVGAQ